MTIDIRHWNGRFLDYYNKTGEALNQAEGFQITIERATRLQPGEKYWACVGVRHLSGQENKGNHHVFCDVLDVSGNRIDRAKLQLTQGHLKPVTAVVDKPPNEAGTNFPIWGETPSDVMVDTWSYKSDIVKGFRINHPDEPGEGNTIGHHSFYVVWMLVEARHSDVPLPEPSPEIERPVDEGQGEIKQVENLTFNIGNDYQADVVIVIRNKK